jgi:putative endopeptidase
MSASDRLLNSRNHPHGTRYMPNLRPTTLALALTLVVAVGSPDAMAQKKKRAAAKKPVAEKIDACGDFYTYNHKAWLDSNMYVGGSGMTSAMSQLRERALQQQIDLLNANMQSAQGGIGKLLGDFWASGLDEAAVEADGANPIAPLLDRINGIKRDRDIAPAIAALHQVGIPALFNFSANIDLQDFDRHLGYFTQGGLGLPDPAWYTRNDPDTAALFGRYQAYVKQILTLTGSPADKVDADLAAVLDLEKRVAGISKPISLLRDPRANYAVVPTANLAKQYRKLQLLDFLKAQGVTDDSVSMADPQLFAQLDTLWTRSAPTSGRPTCATRSVRRWRRTCRRRGAMPTSSSAAACCAAKRRRARARSRCSMRSTWPQARCSAATT